MHEKGREGDHCFLFSELWKAYATWTAFGAESPYILETGNGVIQFYHPTLSALQIYTIHDDPSLCFPLTLTLSDSKGCSSTDPENMEEKGFKATEENIGEHTKDQDGHLYLHYNEESDPDKRLPFFLKINELADTYPALMTLKSTHLCRES